MSKGPIFDRSVQLTWLDEALRLRRTGRPDARARLEMWLRDRVESATGRKKTLTILSRVWLDPPAGAREIVSWAAEIAPDIRDTRILHIGAMLATHAFFGRACAVAGRQLGLEGVVGTDDLRIRLRKTWGDREVVDVGARSVIRTLRGVGVLSGEPGRSESRPGERISVPAVLSPWLAHALAISRGTAELDGRELGGSAELFMLDVPSLQPNGYPHGDVFMEGGGRVVFRPHMPSAHPSRAPQSSLPGIRTG